MSKYCYFFLFCCFSLFFITVDAANSFSSPCVKIQGYQIANEFATQTDLVNVITWKIPRGNLSPAVYHIYRSPRLTNKSLAAVISADEKLRFEDHNRREGHTYHYFLVAFDESDNELFNVKIVFKGSRVHFRQISCSETDCSAPTVTTTTLPDGFLTFPYSQTIQTTGGVAPITFDLIGGTPPPGLTLSSDGIISGTPTEAGTFSFAFKVISSCGSTITETLEITVTQPTLFGVTGAGNQMSGAGAPSSLYRINPVTGATILVGATGFNGVTGIAFDRTTGILYGVVSDLGGTGDQQLITINPLTGVGTFIGDTGHQIPDIAIGTDGIIRGWTEDQGVGDDDPITINKTTGAVTVTAVSSLNTAQTGVAIAGPNLLYIKNGDDLYTVGQFTGTDTFLWTFPNDMNNLLENNPDGTLISGFRDVTSTQLYNLDPATGVQTALGISNVRLSGIAYAPF